MSNVRIGIIGVGTMGATHARNILAGKIDRLQLAAVADINPARFEQAPGVKAFGAAEELIGSGLVDAVLIATPHYDHVPLAIKALGAGLHVMVEKPVAVHKADAQRLIAAYAGNEQKPVLAAMFNQRTNPNYQRIRHMVCNGELGEIRRVNWIITHWYRTEIYYASGGWRATWSGEGGGVLLNQLPHHLDLFQWIFGLPVRLRAHCKFGKYHQIEVEDEVSAYVEFDNGATGIMIASTGESPGTNRLEITGENGRLVYEEDRITFTRNEVPMSEFSRAATKPFVQPGNADVPVPVEGPGGNHNEVLLNFTRAILDGEPLIAPGVEGIHSVELANAMLMSTWNECTVDLPIDAAEYQRQLREKIATSTFRKKETVVVETGADDVNASFGR